MRGACDVADTCTGASKACPDALIAAGTQCRAKNDAFPVCGPAEQCTGASPDCPADAKSSCSTSKADNCRADGSCGCGVNLPCGPNLICDGGKCLCATCLSGEPPTE